MAQKNDFLGTEAVGKLLFRLAIPTIAAQLINMLYNLVDRVYIGHIPEVGALALTGVGVCMPIILIVSAFAAFISSGGAPHASILMGRGEYDSAEQTMGSCFVLQILLSVILTAVIVVWQSPLLTAFGASDQTIPYASAYMRIYSLGTVFVQLTLGMTAYINAQGFSKYGMLTVAIGAVLNILLDPLFIFVLDMGVRGAALATVISQAVSCTFAVTFLTGSKSVLRLKRSTLRLRWSLVLPCLALGVAPFIMQASESVIAVCFNASLRDYGGDIAVGAMTILTGVMQFAMLPLQGLAQGAGPIISYNYGARNRSRVKSVFRYLLITSVVYSALLWIAIMCFPGTFAAMFTSDTVLISFTKEALRIYGGVIVVFGIQVACQMTFISLGKAACSVIVAVVRKFVLLIPLIYVLPMFASDITHKTMLVYTAEPVADIVAVTFTAVLFLIQFRKILRTMSV